MNTLMAKAFFKKTTLFSMAFVLAVSTLTAAVPFILAEEAAAVAGTVEITTVEQLCDAIDSQANGQADGQTWKIAGGAYGLGQCNSLEAGGQTGWYFPITANNLTIKGESNPTIYGTGFTPNGNWNTQNLVSVFGDNVTVDGLTLMPKVEPNKTIEVLGSNFTLRNSVITPNTLAPASDYNTLSSEDKEWGGSLYFSHAGNHTIQNVTINNAGVSFRYAPTGTHIEFSNVKIVNATNVDWINGYRYSSGFNVLTNTTTGLPSVSYRVNATLNNLDSAVAGARNGDSIMLDSSVNTAKQVNLTKSVTLNGNGNSLNPTFTKTGNDNNSVLGVQSDNVTINNLIVNGVGGTNLHGVNVYRSKNVTIDNLTVKNNNIGLVVNGSTVEANDIHTQNSAWGYGINVDKGDASNLAELTISGVSTHTELSGIWVDAPSTFNTVVDSDSQYTKKTVGAGNTYILNKVPVTVVDTPAQNGVVSTKLNGNKLKITGSFTDDKKANYLTFQLVKAGNSVAIGTMYGYGSVFNPSATYANEDGTYTYNLPVPANLANGEYSLFYTGTDFDGAVTQRMERKFIIDHSKPTATLVAPVSVGPFNVGTVAIQVDATDAQGLKKITANVYQGSALKKSTSTTVAGGAMNGTHSTTVSLPDGAYTIRYNAEDLAGNIASTGSFNFTVDTTAPVAVTNLAWKTSGGDVLGSGDATHLMGGVASWNASASSDVSNYNYKYWNDIPTSQYKVGTEYPVNSVSGLSLPGVFNQGVGTHYFSVVAVDYAGNKSEPTVFQVSYNTAFAVTINNVAGDSATPTISGIARWSADNKPVANENLKVVIDSTTYPVQTSALGVWAVTIPAVNALTDGTYTVLATNASDNPVGTKIFTIELPKLEDTVTAAPGIPTTPIPLATVNPAATPAIVNPATFAEILGATTENSPENNVAETKGASTENRNILAVAANSEANKGTFLGLGWYWWLLIVAAVAAAAWWIFGAIRNRQAEN